MPKISNKQALVEKLKDCLRIEEKYLTEILHDDSDDEESQAISAKIVKETLKRHKYTKALRFLNENRYVFKRVHSHKRKGDYLEWLMLQTDRVFRRETRMPTKQAFYNICDRVKDHICYNDSDAARKQRSVHFQVAVVLYRLGLSGGGSSLENVATHCGIGVGTVQTYTKRFFTAILSMSKEWICWPKEDEKKRIIEANEKRFGFPNCVGFVDGSLMDLEFRPKWRDQEFYTRKASYAIQNLAICDDKRRIRYFATGIFGSAHDSRVFTETMGVHPERYFADGEYILADSAYGCTHYMIPPYKRPPNGELDSEKKRFNKMHSGTRIAIEHCFGILKCRFGSLRMIRQQIQNKDNMANASEWIKVCVILHNMLIDEPEDMRLVRKAERLLLIEKAMGNTEEEQEDRGTMSFTTIDSPTGIQLRDGVCRYILARNQ